MKPKDSTEVSPRTDREKLVMAVSALEHYAFDTGSNYGRIAKDALEAIGPLDSQAEETEAELFQAALEEDYAEQMRDAESLLNESSDCLNSDEVVKAEKVSAPREFDWRVFYRGCLSIGITDKQYQDIRTLLDGEVLK